MPTNLLELNFSEIHQGNRKFKLCWLPADALALISYAAVRGRDEEEGAIQRVLNPQRISKLRDFALKGGDYPSSIVLNWVNKENPICINTVNGKIKIPLIEKSAQIIDGQHRIAGLKEALSLSDQVKSIQIPISIYEGLTTKECADIFLSINTEQKPVPKSLVFDLYGISSDQKDSAVTRATDIATRLNEDPESPYCDLIKFPGHPKTKGGIALSTLVSTIKPLIEINGVFDQSGIKEFESQYKVIFNYFTTLKQKYKNDWNLSKNVFMYAAGFSGAIDFLRTRILHACASKKSFTIKTMTELISLEGDTLIFQDEIKGLGGKDAPKHVFDRLDKSFSRSEHVADQFEF
jgi:DGQHR domain-containing protein